MKTCVSCKNLQLREDSRPKCKYIWYNMTCAATKTSRTDYTTGKTVVSYQHCREVNTDGKCQQHKPTNKRR